MNNENNNEHKINDQKPNYKFFNKMWNVELEQKRKQKKNNYNIDYSEMSLCTL